MRKLMIICLPWLLGCGTLNKDKFLGKNKRSETLTQEHQQLILTDKTTIMKDSTHNMMQLNIWPKGRFSFSPTTGFNGEAFKVELKGERLRLNQLSELAVSKTETSTKLKLQKKQVVKQGVKKIQRKGLGYGNGFLLLLLAVIAIWFIRKRFS